MEEKDDAEVAGDIARGDNIERAEGGPSA